MSPIQTRLILVSRKNICAHFLCNFLYTSQCHSILFYLSAITVMDLSSITGMLFVNVIDYARRSRASHERSELKKAKLEKLSNNISDRSEA